MENRPFSRVEQIHPYTHDSTVWGQHPFRWATQPPPASGRSRLASVDRMRDGKLRKFVPGLVNVTMPLLGRKESTPYCWIGAACTGTARERLLKCRESGPTVDDLDQSLANPLLDASLPRRSVSWRIG